MLFRSRIPIADNVNNLSEGSDAATLTVTRFRAAAARLRRNVPRRFSSSSSVGDRIADNASSSRKEGCGRMARRRVSRDDSRMLCTVTATKNGSEEINLKMMMSDAIVGGSFERSRINKVFYEVFSKSGMKNAAMLPL